MYDTVAAKGQAMAADIMISTPGYGVMAGGSHAGFLSPRLSSSVTLALPTLAREQQRLCSVADGSGARNTIPAGPRKPVRDLSESRIGVI